MYIGAALVENKMEISKKKKKKIELPYDLACIYIQKTEIHTNL